MRKNSFLVFLFFLVAQGTTFAALRRYQSFADSKWMLAAFEAVLVCITAWLYIASKPPRKKNRPIVAPSPQKNEAAPTPPPSSQEKIALEASLARLQESDLFSQRRIADLEQEKNSLQSMLSAAEQRVTLTQQSVESSRHTIQELIHELEHITSQVEQERRQHAIELRALLRKEGPDSIFSNKKPVKPPSTQRVAMNPLPTLLLLLSSCQKGLDNQESADWPAGEHRLLVRRKFFELAKKATASQISIISFEHPVDSILSPKISALTSLNELLELMQTHKPMLDQLKRFEPFQFTSERLGATTQWTAFRISWENLDDLIAIAPLSGS